MKLSALRLLKVKQSLGLGDLKRHTTDDDIKTDIKTRCKFVERAASFQYRKK
jgi:hypothetical protein